MFIQKHLANDEKIKIIGVKNILHVLADFISSLISLIIVYSLVFGIFGTDFQSYHIVGKILLILFTIFNLFGPIETYIFYKNNELAITNRRFVAKMGVFDTQTLDIALDKISGSKVEQPFFGKIFNYSTLIIESTGSKPERFEGLKNAEHFKTMITQLLENLEEERARVQAEIQAAEMAKVLAQANETRANAERMRAEMKLAKLEMNNNSQD